VPGLRRRRSEALVHKKHGDAFEGTRPGQCIRSTLHGGFTRGYDTTLVADAHTTNDLSEWGAPPPTVEIEYTNLYWQFQTAPKRRARVVASDEVDFGPDEGWRRGPTGGNGH
jgi:hypothetical protein